jgi:5-formyltetrahydrofolate cyclo-ligase
VAYGVPVHPDEPVGDAKTRLRTTLLAARRGRAESERLVAREAISAHLLQALSGMTCIAAYLPLPTEPLDPRTLDRLAVGARVLVPVVTGAAPLDWCEHVAAHRVSLDPSLPAGPPPSAVRQETGTRRGALGIEEPTGPRLGPAAIAAADAVLVPALAVDRRGHRLGRGGGHYDRTLALLSELRAAPLRIAVVYDDEVLGAVPFDELDQPVTAIVSPGSGLSHLGR